MRAFLAVREQAVPLGTVHAGRLSPGPRHGPHGSQHRPQSQADG